MRLRMVELVIWEELAIHIQQKDILTHVLDPARR